ncbi:MAG: sulfite exporter TauE/SafE family protein [Nitrospinae bacterium]|nr:sulfite exporter TauE/SafE family protein [Nitrospinota bacterium]
MEIIIGFVIAFAIAITGVGAGTVTAPVLMLFLGLEPAVAVGTALGFSTIVKIPAGASYWLKGRVDKKYLLLMMAGGVPGVILGSLMLGHMAADKKLKLAVLTVVGIIVLLSALMNIILMWKRISIHNTEKLAKFIPVVTFFIGIEVGFSSAGAGALGTLLLLYATPLFACNVIGTDIAFGLALSAVGGSLHFGMGNIDLPMMAKLVTGGLVGSFLGSHTANRVPAKPLRVALLAWLVFIGSQLLYRGLTGS